MQVLKRGEGIAGHASTGSLDQEVVAVLGSGDGLGMGVDRWLRQARKHCFDKSIEQSVERLLAPDNADIVAEQASKAFGNQVFAGGDAAQLANSHCLLCHSKGMIDTQPPLTVETWKKEIDKMRAAYGCPLRADQTAGIAKFVSQAISAPAAGGD